MARRTQGRWNGGTAPSAGVARDRLIDAAEVCFERFGVAKTTLEDIATEAGVSRATVYRYFEGGRDEVVLGVVLRETRQFLKSLERRISREDALGDAVVEGVVYTVANVRKNAQLALLFAPDVAGQTTTITGASAVLFDISREFLGPLFARAEAAGQLRPGVTVADATEFVLRMVLSLLTVAGPQRRSPAAEREFTRVYCAGALVDG